MNSVSKLAAAFVAAAVSLTLGLDAARADEPAAPATGDPAAPPTAPAPADPAAAPKTDEPKPAAPKPPPYSVPWQLRPAAALTVIRSDTSFASYEDTASRGGLTIATTLLASVRIPGTGGPGEGLSPMLRFAAVNDSPPAGNGGLAIVNPVVGATYAKKLGDLRLAAFLGATVPIGAGGGDSPDAGLANSRSKGAVARSFLDNTLFAVNDFAVIPGIGLAWVKSGLTVQVEATLFQLWRVRGAAKQPEASKTNFTTGLHVGYFVDPHLSLGGELRYQRWINGTFASERDGRLDDQVTFAVGPRFHQKVGDIWLRPGISYARGLDKPMSAAAPNYHVIQLDIPVLF